jgi:hypothetical protein
MARTTALNQLQDQIEAIRREAYAQGYAAAMQAIRDYAARPASGGETAAATPARRTAGRPRRTAAAQASRSRRTAASRPARAARAPASRPQRGTNARLVQEVLQAIAPRAARPTEIRDALKRDKGVSMAFTSIRHALGQLEARKSVEQVADSKTWRIPEGSAG